MNIETKELVPRHGFVLGSYLLPRPPLSAFATCPTPVFEFDDALVNLPFGFRLQTVTSSGTLVLDTLCAKSSNSRLLKKLLAFGIHDHIDRRVVQELNLIVTIGELVAFLLAERPRR
jgi:hypothetical protein